MLGIDVSSRSLASALWLSPQEAEPKWEREVPNSPSGVDQLLCAAPADVPWVVEPTGRYSLLVVQRAQAAGRKVLLAPPRQAKAFLRSFSPRAKTDRLDGRGLALFAHSRPLRPFGIKSENVDQLDQLLSARRGLSRSVSRLKLQAQSLPKAQDALRPAIDALASQLKSVDRQIAGLAKEHPEFGMVEKMMKVPGIGSVTATAITSRLVAKSFCHPDQFVAYLGLDIGVRQSGKRRGDTGLTKQGDAELRRLLYVCAQATLRCKDNPFKTQYAKEREKGLTSTGALCAVARKLAHVCWSMHKHQSDYDPQRVGKAVRPGDQAEAGTSESTASRA